MMAYKPDGPINGVCCVRGLSGVGILGRQCPDCPLRFRLMADTTESPDAADAGGHAAIRPALSVAEARPASHKIGDVVRLKSGGPFLTVCAVGATGSDIPAGCVDVRWFDADGRLGHAVFNVETISDETHPR